MTTAQEGLAFLRAHGIPVREDRGHSGYLDEDDDEIAAAREAAWAAIPKRVQDVASPRSGGEWRRITEHTGCSGWIVGPEPAPAELARQVRESDRLVAAGG